MSSIKTASRSLGAHLLGNFAEGLKSFAWFEQTTVRGFWSNWGYTPGSRHNYAAEAGDLWRNSTVFACLNTIRRMFPEAPLGVRKIGTDEIETDHPLTRLVRRPNPVYGRSTLWSAAYLSWGVDGNSYIFKVRDGAGRVVQLWYRPYWMVEPKRDPGSRNLIDYYQYTPPGAVMQRIDVRDVIHIRNGIDPDNEMKGLSDLKALLRTVATDNQAQNFTASMLRNMGSPGPILTVNPNAMPPSPEQAQAIKNDIKQHTSGDNVGNPLFVGGPMNVVFPESNIDGAALLNIKKITQADIAAAIGIPPEVVGLLVGLENGNTRANRQDARKQAYESCLVPAHRSFAEDLDLHLLPELGNPDTEEFAFDYSQVQALTENTDAVHKRYREDWEAGLIDRATAKKGIGEEALPEDEGVYYSDVKRSNTSAPAAEPSTETGETAPEEDDLPTSSRRLPGGNGARLIAAGRNGRG